MENTNNRKKIVVLDFGSQYAHLIAKRFRALGFYSEIALPSASVDVFKNAMGIVFSGGPASVYDEKVPDFNSQILNLDIPILGLCYGHYIVQQGYGGKVGKADVGEFGFATLNFADGMGGDASACPLFKGISGSQQVWMSHQDGVLKMGDGFEVVGSTKDCPYAATQNLSKKRFSLQFHCEVKDTPCGNKIFENFAAYCGMEKNWDQATVLNTILENIKRDSGDKNVLLFLSGGVDSTVAFALLNKALGQKRVLGLHIDNGFMRKNESASVAAAYKKFGFENFIARDASQSFLAAIAGLVDPQKKRMAVGENFITVRDQFVAEQKLDENNWLLAQGTLYPDIIESGGTKNSNTIKTHHNRVAGIQALLEKGLIIEPLKDLYKDEVRSIGKALGLSDQLVMRHPFPGPGLSINVLCSEGELSADQVEELKTLMQGKICLFSGHSGVGKSALVNALDPSLNVRIGAISGYHEKGKHTTTFAEMHHLDFGAWIVDTPGIKEFVLYDLEKETLAQRFPEMRDLMSECRFANCTHIHEPGCAVKAAVENGDIADWRYVNYLRMMTDESHESVKEEG